jgi:hypothetical protein
MTAATRRIAPRKFLASLSLACLYRTKLLEFSEETLDQVTFFGEKSRSLLSLRLLFGGMTTAIPHVAQPFDQGVRIVTFVAEQLAVVDGIGPRASRHRPNDAMGKKTVSLR